MDKQENERDNSDRRNSNTEYIPTKCRITKPPPPKPATNPLQFVKVAPCPLFQKAHEQIKKVEEIKKERKEIRDETEDWQQNLDNWKSSRRKQQEHIIERVVEVKKLTEQEELEKSRRKSKTFSEMMEERNRGRHKFTIPIYNDDDLNDLSDYGIGSSSSKTNSIKDVDTDDSCSILDEKDNHSCDSTSNKDNSSASNQSQSEDETNNLISNKTEDRLSTLNNNSSTKTFSSTYITTLSTPSKKPAVLPKTRNYFETKSYSSESAFNDTNEQYTYEGAIQDYRSRIQSKIKVDESIFTKNAVSKSKEYSEAQTVLPKGEISKRKGLFEPDKPLEINHMESTSSRRLSEDFANSRSIKDRLKSLEKSTDQSIKSIDKNDIQILSVKQRLQNLNKQSDDTENNNINRPNKISSYLLDKSKSTPTFETKNTKPTHWKSENSDRSSSPETELYMNKLNMFSRDLDNLMGDKSENNDYAPSLASVELTGISSDREDSGIHTADVSCSVSQADEPIDTDNETSSTTIPSCIEKLKTAKEVQDVLLEEEFNSEEKLDIKQYYEEPPYSNEELIQLTKDFLNELIKDASQDFVDLKSKNVEVLESNIKLEEVVAQKPEDIVQRVPEKTSKPPAIYENVELKPYANFIMDEPFSFTPPKLEPPKVKPPPPPPQYDIEETAPPKPVKRMNSTKRIRKEIHIKRSSFLGLDDQNIDMIDPDIMIEKPPDLQGFLQKESKLEKSLFKKMQEENRCGILSKVESQDSGLDIDRGRLSSDTWCSSIGDSSTPNHERHDSEHTSSITSEEDEITKKEREIIEMVEKEEKTRDNIEYVNQNTNLPTVLTSRKHEIINTEPSLGSEEFDNPYFPQSNSAFITDQDSEVLKVEQELRQLEKEELDRQRENMLFRESRAKARLQNNRHSLENICDEIYPCYANTAIEYRKSMPELEYRKSVTDLPTAYYRSMPENDIPYRKSMPDIQRAYQKSTQTDQKSPTSNNCGVIPVHRKSMPELQHDAQRSAFKSPPSSNRQPIMPGKPIRTIKEPIFSIVNGSSIKTRPLSKHSLHALSAVPRPRHNDNWIQPKVNPEVKSYNQHWVFQEAELRRISDQQKNAASNRNWQQPRHEKHLPDSIIQSLTQRVQNRTNINDRNPPLRRPDGLNKDYIQHSYLGHTTQSMGHALPTVPYSPPLAIDEPSQDRMLSVSGKKKCSYCGKELGRGAAMIIESLCLFYHMDCFKCCVCHIQLGDGRMGTDVRVRNQKLHCHNCYSSDDGVKFSCV